ncbi:hypothetical protein IG631_22644 [Alternaria alternata]|nr:hypothetical protein IG631_22644 [Alternaria alternata]
MQLNPACRDGACGCSFSSTSRPAGLEGQQSAERARRANPWRYEACVTFMHR